MGKSLNMDMLYTFLDNARDTKDLFKNLYISESKYMEYANQFPVIFLSFKDYDIENFQQLLKYDIIKFIKRNIDVHLYYTIFVSRCQLK
jgi:hypothetical protein